MIYCFPQSVPVVCNPPSVVIVSVCTALEEPEAYSLYVQHTWQIRLILITDLITFPWMLSYSSELFKELHR